MKTGSKRLWPLVLALILLLVVTALLLADSLRRNDGHLIYALDDPYIHMAMAKNMARHGVWGVTPHGFTSVSSSPLWTLLLAGAFAVFGNHATIPLILNLLFAALLLIAADILLRRHAVGPLWRFAALGAIAQLVPLPPVILTGQEHILHALLAVLFAGLLAETTAGSTRRNWPLLLVALLLTAVRYESLFLIAGACLILLIQRRFRLVLALAAAAALPVVLYGLVSLAHGWFFLPTSVLMKGEVARQLYHILHPARASGAFALSLVQLLGWNSLKQILTSTHILPLIVAGLLLLLRRGEWNRTALLLLFVLGTVLHLQFARLGPLHRYEAYLLVLGLLAVASAALPSKPLDSLFPRLLFPAALLVMAWPAHHVLRETPVAAANIYRQQYQMGLFLRRCYNGRAIAANDVGAINWLADLDCLDTWGMSSIEIGRARARNRYTAGLLDSLCRSRGTEMAVVYKNWLLDAKPGRLPDSWVEAGAWTIKDNIVCGEATVTFFACDSGYLPALLANLRLFSADLPAEVVQSGLYLR
ncbi:MAG: hypothetical protein ABIK37_01085 [candidate division WOR-3 bacterium]